MQMIDAHRLDEVVHSHAEMLCHHFFPEGRKVGKEWRIASSPRVGRKKHKPGSLAIQIAGPYAGSWRDWATDERGAFVRLVMTKDNLNFPDAARAIGAALGINLETSNV
jgi:twinkle protein